MVFPLPSLAKSKAGTFATVFVAIAAFGFGCTKSLTDNPPPPAPTADIKANGAEGQISISYNASATISWTSTNATGCSVSPLGGTGTSGSQSTGNLTSAATYTLSCSGSGGTVTAKVIVNVGPAPAVTVNLTANGSDGPVTVAYNTAATLTLVSTNATSCAITPGGFTGTSGTWSTGNLTSSTTYTATCSGPGGTATDNVVVNVGTPPAGVVLKVNGVHGSIALPNGGSANLNWVTTGAPTSCMATGSWSGSKSPTGGTETQGPLAGPNTFVYVLACSYAAGTATDSARVVVSASLSLLGAAISACDRSGGICYKTGDVLPVPSGPYDNTAAGRADPTIGFDALYYSAYNEQCATFAVPACDARFILNDPFLGPAPIKNDSAKIVNGWSILSNSFRMELESAIFSATDSVATKDMCLGAGQDDANCRKVPLAVDAGNVLGLEGVVTDIATGQTIAEHDTLITGKHYNLEIRIFGSQGLHGYYIGTATSACNVAGGIGCGAISSIFDVFGNSYTPGTWKTQDFLLIAPNTPSVIEYRVTDGVRTKAIRLHLYAK